jgi:serine/threonine protein kinase
MKFILIQESLEINIARFVSYGFFNENQMEYRYLVLKKYDIDLLSRIQIHPCSLTQVSVVTSQLLNGLKYLHSIGISHGDINPANILVDTHLSYACLSSFERSNIFLINNIHRSGLNMSVVNRNKNFIGRDAYYQRRMNEIFSKKNII